MKNRMRMVVPLLLACWVTGCLEFERQTMSYRHDAATDTLYIFQDYQGIFGVDDPGHLSETELEQLTSVMQGERTFFFNNWITEYNRALLKEKLQTAKGELEEDQAYEASIRALMETALANVKVENVGFYLDRSNRLCGAQRVTVKHISKLLAALNQVLSFVAREAAGEDDTPPEVKQRLRAFADRGEKTLRLDGNRLEFCWPISAEDYRNFRDQTPQGRAFRKAGGAMSHTNGLIVLTLGRRKATTVSLTLPFSEKPYTTNCLAAASPYGIKPKFDPVAAAKAFLAHPGSAKAKTQ